MEDPFGGTLRVHVPTMAEWRGPRSPLPVSPMSVGSPPCDPLHVHVPVMPTPVGVGSAVSSRDMLRVHAPTIADTRPPRSPMSSSVGSPATELSPSSSNNAIPVIWPTPQWAYFNRHTHEWTPFGPEEQTELEHDCVFGHSQRILQVDRAPCVVDAKQREMRHPQHGIVPMRRELPDGRRAAGLPVAWANLNPKAQCWEFFPPHVSEQIEAMYQRNEKEVNVAVLNHLWFTIVFETMTQINEESQFRHVRRFKMRPQWEYFQPNLQKWMSFSESDVSLLQAASQSGGSEVDVDIEGIRATVQLPSMTCRLQGGVMLAVRQYAQRHDSPSMWPVPDIPNPNPSDVQRHTVRLQRTKRQLEPKIMDFSHGLADQPMARPSLHMGLGSESSMEGLGSPCHSQGRSRPARMLCIDAAQDGDDASENGCDYLQSLQKEAHYGSDDGRCCRVHRDKGQRVQDMADEGFCNGEGDNFRAPQFDSKGNLIRQLTEEGEYVDATLQRNPIAERVLRDGFCDDREFAEEDEYEDESIRVQRRAGYGQRFLELPVEEQWNSVDLVRGRCPEGPRYRALGHPRANSQPLVQVKEFMESRGTGSGKKKLKRNSVGSVSSLSSVDSRGNIKPKRIKPRVDSTSNLNHVPRGGKVKIIHKPMDFSHIAPRVDDDNLNHQPGGGDVKIVDEKLQWKAKPKVDDDNLNHQPGGGDVKIVGEKVTWKAKPKVDDDNLEHVPGGGDVKIVAEKVTWKAKPRVDDDNLDHVPGGGNVRIVDRKLSYTEKAKAKVDHNNLAHVPKGGKVKIVNEAPTFAAKAKPRVDDDNLNHVPGGGKVKIVNEPLAFRSKAKSKINLGK